MEPNLNDEVTAFIAAQANLRAQDGEPWVVFADRELQGRFPSFEEAYAHAVQHHEPGKFLIRGLDEDVTFVPLVFVQE